ncbi:MAG: alpha/beta fold hydrolase, partial [Anaerolineales bacterium]
MPKIQFSDFTMAYDDVGSGKAILFIHGFPLTRKMWQPQMEGLSAHFRIIAPDLRGHGESTPTKGVYSMELLADDCAALLDQLNIHQVTVCGLSMGGYIAFAFAKKHADRLAGLILTATRASADTPEGKSNRDRTIQEVLQTGKSGLIETMIQRLLSPASLKNNLTLVNELRTIMESVTLDAIVGDLYGMKERADVRPWLNQI